MFSRSILPRPFMLRPGCSRSFQASFSVYRPVAQQLKLSTVRQRVANNRAATWMSIAGGVGLGLSMSSLGVIVMCEPATPPASRPVSPTPAEAEATAVPEKKEAESEKPLPPPPESILNLYELSFGTVAGICAGVFVKKGAKTLAFFVGGIFVLLQYFSSLSIITVNWTKVGNKFENLFYTTAADGSRRPPTIGSLWRWLVDFLAADFQPRASFIAGLVLGLRIG